jgi:hypothetical protein
VRSVWYRWTAPSSGDFTAQTCETPNASKELKRGTHTFKVRATDEAGNTGPNAAKTFRSSRR